MIMNVYPLECIRGSRMKSVYVSSSKHVGRSCHRSDTTIEQLRHLKDEEDE